MSSEIVKNTRLLATSVKAQVHLTYLLLCNFDLDLYEEINDKDDYIDNLKTVIENKCFSRIHGLATTAREEMNVIRALHVTCVNLERIADFSVNIARQMTYLSDRDVINQYDHKEMFTEIETAISKVVKVFRTRDLAGALEICRAEFNLDEIYQTNFDQIMTQLGQQNNPQDLVTIIFIFRYLERIGDSLLNIGEALIFAIIGDRIKIRQIDALERTLSDSGYGAALAEINTQSIWGSRSGCRIARVEQSAEHKTKPQAIFKEGVQRKIKREKENIRKWDKLVPGLAPQIFGYHEKGPKASMLVEFLSGCSLDEVILTGEPEYVNKALAILEETVDRIWTQTLAAGQTPVDYIAQLTGRLDAVQRVHPDFIRRSRVIENARIQSTTELLEICNEICNQVPAPFRVYIHGDFNLNNIVYNHYKEQVHYIDLHRSKMADYVQDASVFLVSNYRLPVFEPRLRERLDVVITRFWEAFAAFAEQHGDRTFEVRMALSLVRSFYTSTRFELKESFAREMYLRAHFLMEHLAAFKGSWESYRLPDSVFVH
jgi:phosphate uptake regulator